MLIVVVIHIFEQAQGRSFLGDDLVDEFVMGAAHIVLITINYSVFWRLFILGRYKHLLNWTAISAIFRPLLFVCIIVNYWRHSFDLFVESGIWGGYTGWWKWPEVVHLPNATSDFLDSFPTLMLTLENFYWLWIRHHFHRSRYRSLILILLLIDRLDLLYLFKHGCWCTVFQERLQFELSSPQLVSSVWMGDLRLIFDDFREEKNIFSFVAISAALTILFQCQVIVRGGSGVILFKDVTTCRLLLVV